MKPTYLNRSAFAKDIMPVNIASHLDEAQKMSESLSWVAAWWHFILLHIFSYFHIHLPITAEDTLVLLILSMTSTNAYMLFSTGHTILVLGSTEIDRPNYVNSLRTNLILQRTEKSTKYNFLPKMFCITGFAAIVYLSTFSSWLFIMIVGSIVSYYYTSNMVLEEKGNSKSPSFWVGIAAFQIPALLLYFIFLNHDPDLLLTILHAGLFSAAVTFVLVLLFIFFCLIFTKKLPNIVELYIFCHLLPILGNAILAIWGMVALRLAFLFAGMARFWRGTTYTAGVAVLVLLANWSFATFFDPFAPLVGHLPFPHD